jgi:uncharacterized radical SAM superfamily protein
LSGIIWFSAPHYTLIEGVRRILGEERGKKLLSNQLYLSLLLNVFTPTRGQYKDRKIVAPKEEAILLGAKNRLF